MIIIKSLIWLDREKYKLSFDICYDIVIIRARERCKVAQMTLCLLLSILNTLSSSLEKKNSLRLSRLTFSYGMI